MRRLIAAAACLVALVPATSAHAEDEAGAVLVSYSLAANAPGLGIEGLYKDVALTVPETNSALSTGGVGTGFAAVAWPGPIVGNLGTTLLVLNGSLPPGITILNDPIRAESHSGGTEKATFGSSPGPQMSSTATRAKVTASSDTGTGTTLPIGSVGAITGSSSTTLVGSSKAVSTATSRVVGISLADGLITIGAVQSTATVTSDGTKATATGSTQIADLKIAGIEVSLTGQSLSVAGTSIKNPLAVNTLNNALKALGLTVMLTEPHTVLSGSSASYDAGALVLLYHQGASTYALTLGRASASASATKLVAEPFVPGLTGQLTGSAPTTAALTPGPSGTQPTVAPSEGGQVTLPAIADALVPLARSVLLAGGAPGALVLPLLLVVGLLGFLLPRLPERFIATTADDTCEERQG